MTAVTATGGGEQVTVVTITFGSPVANDLHSSFNASGGMGWAPSSAARTPTGIACFATAAAASGTTDRDL